MDTNQFDIEKTFRNLFKEAIMGEKLTVGRITFNPKMCDYELQNRLNHAENLLQHIRNNWDKEDFDGEEMDKRIDDLLGKIR